MTEQTKKGSLGDILSASQIISPADISAALAEQARCGCRFGEALIKLGIVTPEDIDWALSNQLDLPYIRLKQELIDPEAVRLVPAALARTYSLIPLIKSGNELNIAIADPLNHAALAAVEQASGCRVNCSVALLGEILATIDACYGSAGQEKLGFESDVFSEKARDAINADLSGAALLEYLLLFFLQNRLTTLSLQPLADQVAINGRRGGVTRPIGRLASAYYPEVTRHIRSSAAVTATSTSCSGLLTMLHHKQRLPFQVAILAGIGGDLVTIRRHISAVFPASTAELHLPKAQYASFAGLTRARHGITFFASRNVRERNGMIDLMLSELDTIGRNCIILGEGPGQGGRFPRIALPIAEQERSRTIQDALEQAPDILIIEEVSGVMPFSAACRAAMRGKLVLAGLDIRGTRNALQQLVLYHQKNYFLPFFVNGLVSFKGAQLLCPECRSVCEPPAEELLVMNLPQPPAAFFRTSGCDACGQSGFSGRRYLMDVLLFDEPFRQLFEKSADVATLEAHLGSIGYRGIAEEGLQLLMDGQLSPEEYIAAVLL